MAVNSGKVSSSKSEAPIIISSLILGVVLAGGLLSSYKPGAPLLGVTPPGSLCCDSGSGPNCHPIVDNAHPAFTYNGQQYELLKSSITIADCAKHLRDSGIKGPNKEPIILDSSNEIAAAANNAHEVCNTGSGDIPLNTSMDTLADYRNGHKACFPIPDEELIYLCVANCGPAVDKSCDSLAKDYYGSGKTVYNVYFRMRDYGVARTKNPDTTPNGIPDVVQNCNKPEYAWNSGDNKQNSGTSPTIINQQIVTPVPYPSHYSLQMNPFYFTASAPPGPQQWLRPWCKPAIDLYPTEKENITVKVTTQGKLLTTTPYYPAGGWQVTAYPDGKIMYKNTPYDYLYYEAAIPDSLLSSLSNNTGYVVQYDKLPDLFSTLLPKLGLNTREINQFSPYWLKVLPKSPYYFISIVPQMTLNTIAPLTVIPTPDTVIRVSLNFQPLDTPISVTAPVLSPISRRGFTIVEWGGLFKQDKNHPNFTCLM